MKKEESPRIVKNQTVKNQIQEKQTSYKWLYAIIFFAAMLVVGVSYYLHGENTKEVQKLNEFYLIKKSIQEEEFDIEDVQKFIVKYENTKQVNLLKYYVAVYYLSQKSFKEAEEWLLLTNIDEENTISILSKLLLANIYQQQNKYQEAIDILSAVDISSMTDYLTLEIIGNNILAGRIPQARDLLNSFLDTYRRSTLKPLAEELLKTIN